SSDLVGINSDADFCIGGLAKNAQLVADGTPVTRATVDVHFDVHLLGFNAIGINQITDTGGVMYRAASQTVVFELGFQSEVHDVAEQLSGRAACPFHPSNHARSANGLVGEIEAHHHQRNAGGEHHACGFRVSKDVELGRWGEVASTVSAAHQHNFT